MKPIPRLIAHLDMDAFFASVELLQRPDLRGQAVVVGGRNVPVPAAGHPGSIGYTRLQDYIGRGVITTATYEARALGVHSGMGLMKAARLAPNAILLPVNFNAYRHYSRRFKSSVIQIAPHMEDRGIDEIYLDLSSFSISPLSLGRRIKQAVHDATGLSCSLAISPNKLLSKIGSDLAKPDGLLLLQMQDIPQRIWPIAVNRINGIGPKANAKLQAMGIYTIGELAQANIRLLQNAFGVNYATWLNTVAHGIDERPVVTYSEPKSISRETTFTLDLHPRWDRQALADILSMLCHKVADDLHRKGYRSRTIGVKLRSEDFSTITRDQTLREPTQDWQIIRQTVRECLRRVPLERKLRLLGVRAGSLSPEHLLAKYGQQEELPLDMATDKNLQNQ